MNFLAHLKLAEPTAESRAGNLLGDFVKGLPWDDRFSPAIWQGIMEHRHLDVFTDKHNAWKRSRDRLQPENRRFAGIIIDIYYDFFLARHWSEFHPEQDLKAFVKEVHRDLKSLRSVVPTDARQPINRMIRQKWLLSYSDISGVRKTLRRVAYSSDKLKAVRGLERELTQNMVGLEQDFLEFFPAVILEAERLRAELRPIAIEKQKNL